MMGIFVVHTEVFVTQQQHLQVPKPDHLADMPCTEIQCTLVDCPGHASLIRTIIGGAQIIDVMLLVVDVTKGIQTQTAECLVIGELCAGGMVVVLNKVWWLDDGGMMLLCAHLLYTCAPATTITYTG